MDIFEKTSRMKYRFPSPKGDLTIEHLWDLPLQARGGCDLDTVARTVNAELKSVTEESFVETRPNPKKGELEDKLTLVKHVIATKIAENKARVEAAGRQEKIRKLEDALAKKGDAALDAMSSEQIAAELAALRAA